MNEKTTIVDRSNALIISFQLDGLCTALRQSIGRGLPPGPGALKTLQELHAAFALINTGPSLNVLQKIDSMSTPSDVLAFAEVLRATAAAFLSPDEVTEKRHAIGFHTEA